MLTAVLGGLGCDSGTSDARDAGRTPGTDAQVTRDSGMVPADSGRTETDAGPTQSAIPAGAADRLVGSWAMQTGFANVQTLPFLGDQRSVTTALALVDVTQNGDALQWRERGCHVEVQGSGSTMTTIPDTIPQSIAPRMANLEFREVAGAWHWVRPDVSTAVGWRPAGTPGERLPQMASDPRVFDQDNDNQPGVTVSVRGIASGDVYVVQTQRGWMTGPIGTTGDIRGENHAEGSEQKTIGASVQLLNMDIAQRPDTNTADNTVRLVRLSGTYDCARLINEADTLFR